jgi:hypothetical protein
MRGSRTVHARDRHRTARRSAGWVFLGTPRWWNHALQSEHPGSTSVNTMAGLLERMLIPQSPMPHRILNLSL